MKIQKKKLGGGSGQGGVSGWGRGGCEWRSEAFVKIKKKYIFFFFEGRVQVRGVRVNGNGEVKL